MSYKKLKSILEDGYLKIYVDELKDKLKEHGIEITNAEEENYEVTISFSIHGIPSRSQIVEIKNLFKDKEENNDTINIIFCENIDKIEHKSENIIYIDIDKEVFRYFNEEDYNDGQEMIQRMIGIQS